MMDERPVALITGGTRRLGSQLAQALMGQGYTVYITSRSSDPSDIHFGGRSLIGDPGDPRDASAMVGNIEAETGRLDVLINNASSYHTGPLLAMDDPSLRDSFEGCIYPVLFMTRAAIPLMARCKGNVVIIGMAGTGEVKGYREVAAHAAAKTAVNVLARSLSFELDRFEIALSLINPGRISFEKDDGGEVDAGTVVYRILDVLDRKDRGFLSLDVVHD